MKKINICFNLLLNFLNGIKLLPSWIKINTKNFGQFFIRSSFDINILVTILYFKVDFFKYRLIVYLQQKKSYFFPFFFF